MMPWLVTVRVKRAGRRTIRVWVPVLVLLPLLVLAALAGVVACMVYRISVVRALGAAGGVVSALPGTRFDMEYGRTGVLVAIR
ncbi:hypothetical protein [Sinosporangium siamense]|uniref:Uncharacterized protein n=1 Tax=Sinosporangium siamense TaxID=1367973 RepID=A0A919V7K3_9ACTN|nr:hypothetical protein [Sinosporangium siamense]GII93543.1 hypothetical protein Ssi02_37740 [Sinosporangium siamense]